MDTKCDRYIRLLRILASLVLLTYACFFISGTLTDWEENPVQTIIESTAYPVQSIPFPAITVCPGDNNRPMYYGFVETFFNFIRLECDNQIKGSCEAVESTRKAFSFILDPVETAYREGLLINIDQNVATFSYLINKSLQSVIIKSLLSPNKSVAIQLISDYEQLLNSSHVGQVNMASFASNKLSEVTKLLGVLPNVSDADWIRCQDDSGPAGCNTMIRRWQNAAVMSRLLFYQPLPPTGTLLRSFANLVDLNALKVGVSLNPFSMDNVDDIAANRLMMKTLGVIMGLTGNESNFTISLLELPGVVQPQTLGGDCPFLYSLTSTMNVSRSAAVFLIDGYSQAWARFIKSQSEGNGSVPHPCVEGDWAAFCRQLTSALQANVLSALKVMRYSQPNWRTKRDLEDQIRTLFDGDLYFLNKYATIGQQAMSSSSPWRVAIPDCLFTEVENRRKGVDPCVEYSTYCDIFEPMWTDAGTCITFNALPFSKAFNVSSPPNDLFTKVYGIGDVNKTLTNISGSGQAYSFSVILDGNQLDSTFMDASEFSDLHLTNATFLVSVSNILNFFKVRSGNAITVLAGEKVTLRVLPSEMIATDQIRSIPIARRRCRFSDETEGLITLFNYYTQSACKFECFIRKAADVCRCIPYNYPNVAGAPLCDHYGAYCFSLLLSGNRSQEADCGCVPDCQEVSYSYSVSTKQMDLSAAGCNGFDAPVSPIALYILVFLQNQQEDSSTKFGEFYDSVLYNKSPLDWTTYCRLKVLTDLAEVNVEIATDTIIRSRNQEKSTFQEKIAYVGGTIGLFNGMSFITIVDIVILVMEGLRSKRSKRKTPILHKRRRVNST